MDAAMGRQGDTDRRRPFAQVTAATAPVMFAYASHFLLFHRVTEHSIPLLQAAFPRHFSGDRDHQVLEAGQFLGDGVLSRFAEAGYLEPAAPVDYRDQVAWVVPGEIRELLQHELLRFGPTGVEPESARDRTQAEAALRSFRRCLLEPLRAAASDTATGEPLIGELAVQLRFASEWAGLEELWYRYGMRIMVTDPVATHEAFGSIPEPKLHEYPGLWLAHVYVESTSVMQRIRSLPAGENVDLLVERLSLQVTECTATLGPRWQRMGSADARLHVGINWMRFQRLRGDFTGALATLGELQKLLEAHQPAQTSASDRNRAFFRLEQGILYFFVDRLPEALEALRESTLLWQRPGYGDYIPAFAWALMGLIYELRGPRAQAAECLAQAQAIFGEVWDFEYVSVLTITVEAMLALDRLDIERAREMLEKLEIAAPRSEMWPVVMIAQQWGELLAGDVAAAARTQARLSERATGAGRLSPFAVRVVHRVRVVGLLALGQAQRARGYLERQAESPIPPSHESWAGLLLAAGRADQVLRHVDIALNDPRVSDRDRASAQLMGAAAHLVLGDEPAADRACTAAVEELALACTLVPLATLPPRHRAELAARCAKAPGWRGLLKRLGLDPEEAAARIASIGGSDSETALLVDLTSREADLLRLIDQGLTQAEMAKRLHVALTTVKKQVAVLYRKMGADSRAATLERAYRIGLFDDR